jgi:hypothetical protein
MFYDKVLADTDLFPFFESIDMSKLKKHQVRKQQLQNPGCALWTNEARFIHMQCLSQTLPALQQPVFSILELPCSYALLQPALCG